MVTDETGAVCSVSALDQRDYLLVGCGTGGPIYRLRTNYGFYEWATQSFEDGATLRPPPPARFEITVVGTAEEAWDRTRFSVHGSAAITVPFEVEQPDRDRRVLTGRAYPGEWSLVVSNARIGTQRFYVDVAGDVSKTQVELEALRRLRVHVVDRYSAPATGAYVMLFDGDRLVDVSRSAGQLPVEFTVRPPFSGRVLAVDPRKGEGVVDWTTDNPDGETERLVLREKVLRHRVPPGRPDRETLADILDARLVASDSGWLIDPESEGTAAGAGFQRGDWIVTAWPTRDGAHRVVVFRRSVGYVDAVVR